MKYVSYNKEEIKVINGNEEISVKWSNVENFSTTALWKIGNWKKASYFFAILGIVLTCLALFTDQKGGDSAGVWFVLIFMYLICPMVASLMIWRLGVKPYKKNFDENKHSITLNLKGNINQIIDCGSVEETIKIFEELKSTFQLNKLQA